MNNVVEPRLSDLQRAVDGLGDQMDGATRALRVCDESEESADLAAEIRREITVKIVPMAMALICLSDGGAAPGCRGKTVAG